MRYEGIIIRPPGEADSLILQVTVGCSHNRCTFCPAYKQKRFHVKSGTIIQNDIRHAQELYGGDIRRVFIADGDALILKTGQLVHLFDELRKNFPRLQRIGVYGNTKSILRKSVEELVLLKEHGLGIVYLGVESGNDEVLRRIRKGVTRTQTIAAGLRVMQAGVKLSVTVLLGIGGTALSAKHAVDTGTLLTELQPDQAAALTVMVVPGTPLYDDMMRGTFLLPDPFALLQELRIMLEHTAMRSGLFLSNHASNYVPLKLRMPKDKAAALRTIDDILASRDARKLRPEHSRML